MAQLHGGYMGLGPPVFALYRQLKALGAFDSVKAVMELGSQNVWCPQKNMIKDIFAAFDRPPPSPELLESFVNWTGSARDFYQGLGLEYQCVDTDGKFGALTLDINFDGVPPDHRGRYDLVTNHGTTEHLINQLNGFRMMHDFTRCDGYMLHALPFLGQVDHGFFNYQPNFFDSLARYNSYRTLGTWVGIDWQLSSFVPWEPKLLDFLALTPKSTGLLIVLHQKMYDVEFQVPFQGHYENTKTEDVSSRYCFVVDGELYDGRRDRFLTRESLQAEEFANRLASAVSARLAEELPARVDAAIAEQLLAKVDAAVNDRIRELEQTDSGEALLTHVSGRTLFRVLVKRMVNRLTRARPS